MGTVPDGGGNCPLAFAGKVLFGIRFLTVTYYYKIKSVSHPFFIQLSSGVPGDRPLRDQSPLSTAESRQTIALLDFTVL